MLKKKYLSKFSGFTTICLFLLLSGGRVFPRSNSQPIEKLKLNNDLTLLYEYEPSSRITVIQIFIKGGKWVEPPGKSGLSYLTTRLTLEIPDQNKLQNIMDQATSLSMASHHDFNRIIISCLSENLEDTLKIISQIMHKPLFSGVRIDRIKRLMNQRRVQELDDSPHLAHYLFSEAFYPGTPYSGSYLGTEESIKSLKKQDIDFFFEHYFLTGNMIFSISSDLDHEKITGLIREYFGEFFRGALPEPEPLTFDTPQQSLKTEIKKTTQSYVGSGYRMPPISEKNYTISVLLENLIGNGIGSRLWPLRTEKKLAYSVNSDLDYSRFGGILTAYLETENQKAELAENALSEELDLLYSQGISIEELESTKTFSKALFLRSNETKLDRMLTVGKFEVLGLGFDFYDKYPNFLELITLEEINQFIQDYLSPGKRVTVKIGPFETENNS